MPELTQFFRFAVRQVIGKQNFAAEAHARARLGSALGARLVLALRPMARMAACYNSPAGRTDAGKLAPIRTRQLFLQPPVRLGWPFRPARHVTEQDRSS